MAAVEHVFVNLARLTDGYNRERPAEQGKHRSRPARIARAGPVSEYPGLYWPAHAPVAELVDAQG
jgi:hypothetical protein